MDDFFTEFALGHAGFFVAQRAVAGDVVGEIEGRVDELLAFDGPVVVVRLTGFTGGGGDPEIGAFEAGGLGAGAFVPGEGRFLGGFDDEDVIAEVAGPGAAVLAVFGFGLGHQLFAEGGGLGRFFGELDEFLRWFGGEEGERAHTQGK